MYVVVAAVAANTTFFVLLNEFDDAVDVCMHLRNGRRVNRANMSTVNVQILI